MKRITVSIVRRVNKDLSTTYSLRWYGGSGHYHCEKFDNQPLHLMNRWEITQAERRVRKAAWKKEALLRKYAETPEISHVLRNKAAVRYLAWVRTAKSKSTWERQNRTLWAFNRWADAWLVNAPQYVSGLVKAHIAAYRDVLAETHKASTVNLTLSDLTAWLKWCMGEDYCKSNEARDVNRLVVEVERAVLPVVTSEGFWAMLAELGPGRWEIPALLGVTGLRIGEAHSMGLDMLDRDTGVLSVPDPSNRPTTTKRHARMIPLTGACRLLAEAGLEAMSNGGSKNVRGWLGALTEPLTPHDLRRFFRTALESTLAPQYAIDDLMGHRTSKVRAAYTPGSNVEAARPVMEQFEWWLLAGMGKCVKLP